MEKAINGVQLKKSKFKYVVIFILVSFGATIFQNCSNTASDFTPSNTANTQTTCKPSSSYSSLATWNITQVSTSYYNIQITVDRTKLNQFKSPDSSCSISKYEVSLTSQASSIIYSTSLRPTLIQGWSTLNSSNTYSYSSVNLSAYSYVSLCFRAFSTSNEESNWYCSTQAVPYTPPTPPPASPTDTTPPTTPTNLSITTYWSSSNNVTLSFTGSTDYQSGISKYWTQILDSSLNPVTSLKSIPSYSISDSTATSSLISGKSYYYSIVSENGAGLQSGIAIASFYKPLQVSVVFKYNSTSFGGQCYTYPTIYNCVSPAKTMFDTQLNTLKLSIYPLCTLTALSSTAYELDCRPMQTCNYSTSYGTCGGVPNSNYYSAQCSAVSGVSVSGSCGSANWNPAMPSP